MYDCERKIRILHLLGGASNSFSIIIQYFMNMSIRGSSKNSSLMTM